MFSFASFISLSRLMETQLLVEEQLLSQSYHSTSDNKA